MIDGSVESVEKDCEQVMITQTFVASRFQFPEYDHGIRLDRYPVRSVESIEYNSEGADVIMDPTAYKFSEARSAVFPNTAGGFSWPTASYGVESVKVTFTAGYGDSGDNVPRDLLQCILLMLSMRFYGEDNWDQYRDSIRKHQRSSYP